MTNPFEDDQFWDGRPLASWRFSKFYLHSLFDGRLHLVQRGIDFPAGCADEDVTKKLRSAAWWRKTRLKIAPCPDGLWVQSPTDLLGLEGTPDLREQLAQALAENARLKEEIWELRNQ